MSETLEVRDFILDFLRKELVGPSPQLSNVQPNGEEILRPQDPPRHRYSAGVLFPMRSEVQSHDEIADDEEGSYDADSPEISDILEVPENGNLHGGNDHTPHTDQEVNLANQLLPSGMGLSALIDVPDQLRVEVSAATYRTSQIERPEDKPTGEKQWLRQPVSQEIVIEAHELIDNEPVTLSKPVLIVEGNTALSLHVVSRPTGDYPRIRLITFTLINRIQSNAKSPRNSECFFQCGFRVLATDGTACFLNYPDRPLLKDDMEALSLQLLYLHKQTFAVGHGCAAEWENPYNNRTSQIRTEVLPVYEVKPILHTEIQGLDLSMMKFAKGHIDETNQLCNGLVDAYEKWIVEREREVADGYCPSSELTSTAAHHLENCRNCLKRLRDGIDLLTTDPKVSTAFSLMNEAMAMQQIHYQISSQRIRRWVLKSGRLELETSFEPPKYKDYPGEWRPFQLAFILMNLKAIADPNSKDREIVDVIWFPTGGGKTEAYLGLSAFTMFLRRLRNSNNAGTNILMRYTLRLLTTQQFQRAASLICACEYIRRHVNEDLGSKPFSIGLWVGSEVTPNDDKAAVTAVRELQKGQRTNKFVLLSCPWCGAAMGPQKLRQSTSVKGYRIRPNPNRLNSQTVLHICEDSDCEFSTNEGLPVAVIDRHIYDDPPTLLVGTVDKFAMLAFRPEARFLFGIDKPFNPPELVIQDELHLISGPLGSMVGHYETVIDALCTYEADESLIQPKIIGSTATISKAENQVKALYGRSAFLFPPQALRAGDSFFAEEREDREGRRYVGVFASSLTSHVTAQVRTFAALLQAPKLAGASNCAIDPYWTMMGYFNSLRELGHAATLLRADIREYLNAMWDRIGLRREEVRKLSVDPRRFINRDVELTSRVQSNDIPSILQQLFANYDNSKRNDAIDVCFATNMIQVGLDIPRLSLMTIVGQPKTSSEYIQASSRIGRRVETPGIVITNFNPFRSRDRSHFEHFRSYHQALYKYVEPTSITPFAVPVRDRALHALIVILCRFWGGPTLRDSPINPPEEALITKIKRIIKKRVVSVDPAEWERTVDHIDEILTGWESAPRSRYGDFGAPSEELPMMYPAGGHEHPLWSVRPYPTPSSMRNVDASCSARPLQSGYGVSKT